MKTYLFIILSFITVVLSAQSHRFADSTAQWNVYMYNPWSGDGNITFNTSIDTMIHGKLYQKISMTPTYQATEDINDYIRQDTSGKVYRIIYDTLECLIYDFGAVVGDTVVVNEIGGGWVSNSTSLIVESIDSIHIGRIRKRISVRSYQSVSETFTWIDGIGLVEDYHSHPFHPLQDLGIADATTYTLLCYHESGQKLYHNEDYDSCYVDVRVGIKDASLSNTLVYPNPTTNHFTLTLNKQPQSGTALLIHDGLGRMVKREELVSSTQQISVADLLDGLYTYTIMQNSVRQASGKLVVSQ